MTIERNDKERVSETISELRKERKMSLDEMGEILHVSGRTVRRWERGEQTPTMDDIINICNEFNLSLEELFDGTINHNREVDKKILQINTDMESISKSISSMDQEVKVLSRTVDALMEQIRIMNNESDLPDFHNDLMWLWLVLAHITATVTGFLCFVRESIGYQPAFVSTLIYIGTVSFLIWQSRYNHKNQKMFMLYALSLSVNMLLNVLLEKELFRETGRPGVINLNNVELIIVNGAMYGLRHLGLYNTKRFLVLCFLCYGMWVFWCVYNLFKHRKKTEARRILKQ